VDYSALNPVIWGLFIGFVGVVWITVRSHRSKHPGYPGKWPEKDE